jgi:hypothetical protein
MHNTSHESHNQAKFRMQRKMLTPGVNKLQALTALASCAAVSIGLIVLGAKSFA